MTDNIYKKLIEVQKHAVAPREISGKFGKGRSAEQILEAYKPVCNKHGLFLKTSDVVKQVGERNYITATATVVLADDPTQTESASAEAWEGNIPLSNSGGEILDSSQVSGKTSSYAKKYALQNLFAIDDTKDADQEHEDAPAKTTPPPSKSTVTSKDGKKEFKATQKQIETLYSLAKSAGYTEQDLAVNWLNEQAEKDITELTLKEASSLIGELMK